MTIGDTLKQLTDSFVQAGFEQPQFEARELLKSLTKMSSADLILRSDSTLTDEQLANLKIWSRDRVEGMPLAYLEKEKGFFKHVFHVDKGILVPRPETELVVEVALRKAALSPLPMKRIADLGAGSGCIGLSLLYEWPQCELWAVESSPRASAMVVKNADRLQIYERCHVECVEVQSWFPEVQFQLIVANPPYIADGDPLVQPSVHKYEPHAALYAGPTGYEAYLDWIPKTLEFLEPGGICVFEIGAGQNEDVREIMTALGLTAVESHSDLAGHVRVISAQKPM